jgi:hypothetical protein
LSGQPPGPWAGREGNHVSGNATVPAGISFPEIHSRLAAPNFPACGLPHWGYICNCSVKSRRWLMDEIKGSALSEEIERLQSEHHRYAQRLEELLQKPYLSQEEQLEEVRLKKLKLHAKDLIFALEHRPAVA